MTTEADQSIQARAIEWHIRLRDGDGATWDAFADWLAQDPGHSAAYDAIEQTDLAIEPLLAKVTFREAANDAGEPSEPQRRPVRRWALVGGIVAAVAAAVFVFIPPFASSRFEVITQSGERRTVTLDPGTRVMLNGSTRMTFDRRNPRYASLDTGEALFEVRHDPSKPFTLEIGDTRVQDLGTIFNVVRVPGEVRVAVAEGKVGYHPPGRTIPLAAGQALVERQGSAGVSVTSTPVAAVGAWQKGRLVYTRAPFSQVAADIARTLGIRITVAPSIAGRPFSGAIALDGTGPVQLRRLKLALNVDLEAAPGRWMMKPVAGAER